MVVHSRRTLHFVHIYCPSLFNSLGWPLLVGVRHNAQSRACHVVLAVDVCEYSVLVLLIELVSLFCFVCVIRVMTFGIPVEATLQWTYQSQGLPWGPTRLH